MMKPSPETADTPHVQYFETAMLPIYFGFTTQEQEYLDEMRRLGVDNPPPFVNPGFSATTHVLTNAKQSPRTICIVCMPKSRRHTTTDHCALLVHEAVHVFQEALKEMNAVSPGGEFEAYAIQYLSQCMISEFIKGRSKTKKEEQCQQS